MIEILQIILIIIILVVSAIIGWWLGTLTWDALFGDDDE